jgi:lipopolysaccharide transport system ATP-binding protein
MASVNKNWSLFFNAKRSFRSYLYLVKWYLVKAITSVPYRLTSDYRKLPDFLIIGVSKGGTTSLFSYLNQHPDIAMSREQETHYFAKYYHRGINYYKSFFPLIRSNKVSGESSPYYFFHPQVPARVKKELPNAKIILLLRDPVTRALSHYQMMKGVDWADSFDEAVKIEASRVTHHHQRMKTDVSYHHDHHQAFSYISRGLYFDQLQNWLKHYRLEELLILKSEDFFENPQKSLAEVYRFLGVKETYPDDLAPKNKRAYESLPKEMYTDYKQLFVSDAEKLIQLLGEDFKW